MSDSSTYSATPEAVAGLCSMFGGVVARVVDGSLDPDRVRFELQRLVDIDRCDEPSDHRSAWPSWYVAPEQQLERVKQLNWLRSWGFEEMDFPSVPRDAALQDGEVLLLCAYLPNKGRKRGIFCTFDELWDLMEAPDGYIEWRWDELKAEPKLLRQAPGYTYASGIRWVAFNTSAYHGKSPKEALKLSKVDNVELAGTEVLMAALLFPTWATSWNGDTSPYPNQSGLQFYWNTVWSRVPYLGRWDGDRRLELNAGWAGHADGRFASPSVREC